jgi:hypothetical protein
MRRAGLLRAWHDELGSFLTWWAASVGMYLAMFARAYEDKAAGQSAHDFVLEIGWFSSAMMVVFALPGLLAFARQRRVARFAAKLLGGVGPLALLYAIDSVAPG